MPSGSRYIGAKSNSGVMRVTPRSGVGKGGVRIPLAVVGFRQQIFGRHSLDAGTAGCQHAVHHHRFVKFGRARQQFVKVRAIDSEPMALDMPFEILYRLPEPWGTKSYTKAGQACRT